MSEAWTPEREARIEAAVRRMRECRHDRWHFMDGGNRRCCQCDAHVREVPGAVLLVLETRTLTDGWVMPTFGYLRAAEEQFRAEVGLPPLPEPVIQDQQRWASEWVDA